LNQELNSSEREKALTNELYLNLFNVVREGFAYYQAIYDDKGKIVDLRVLEINPAGAEFSGVNREAQIGKTWREIWPEVNEQLFAVYQQAADTGVTQRFENNNEITGRWYDVAIYKAAPEEFIAVFQDITERKQSEAQYRTLFNSIDQGFCIIEILLDAEGIPNDYRFLQTNPAFERHTGLVGAVGKSARELVPDLEHHWVGIYGRIMITGQTERFIQSSEAMGRWFEVSAFRVGDLKERKVAMLFTDITERKKAEESLLLAEQQTRRLNLELEQRVTTRTAQLEASNKELESFAYSVSHDLRAPLRAISGFSGILLDEHRDDLNEDGRSYLERIQTAIQRMNQLVDDMLDLSRINRSEMQVTGVNVSGLVRETIAELQQQDPARTVSVRISDDCVAQGDSQLLRIALQNLLDNAWKFTSTTTNAQIEFDCTTELSGELVYYIRDNGVGIDMTYSDKLFGVFQRLHAAHEFPGTGIGLATVQRVINRHGGRIWVESVVGQGATFFFTLQPGLSDEAKASAKK
jgi:PAS domain S-box-containing protein